MVPLYLEGGHDCRVLWEEPALKCVWSHKAEQFFPLNRVSRVVVKGHCEWETNALLACADYGVTLVFLDDAGEIRARWVGRGGERQGFVQRLLDLLARHDGYERYKTWLGAMEKMAVRSAARRLHIAEWQTMTVVELRQAVANDAGFQQGVWRGMLHSQVLAVLVEMGLDAEAESLQSQRLDLAADIAQVLRWDFVVALAELGPQAADLKAFKHWLWFYQGRSERVDVLLKGLLNRLHAWLVELY